MWDVVDQALGDPGTTIIPESDGQKGPSEQEQGYHPTQSLDATTVDVYRQCDGVFFVVSPWIEDSLTYVELELFQIS